MDSKTKPCPICNVVEAEVIPDFSNDSLYINCSHCGEVNMSNTSFISLKIKFEGAEKKYSKARYLISYWIRKKYDDQKNIVQFDANLIDLIVDNEKLPNAAEQANNLILWLGKRLDSPEKIISKKVDIIAAAIGSINDNGYHNTLLTCGC